jgi:hypothetical protein
MGRDRWGGIGRGTARRRDGDGREGDADKIGISTVIKRQCQQKPPKLESGGGGVGRSSQDQFIRNPHTKKD